MLSFLLTAAIAASETPMALCPPCHPEDEPATVLGFLLSLVKSAVSLLVIVFPLYKTFKAWESNRLRACRAMLAYWSAMTLLNALQEVSTELIGGYLNPHLHHLVLAAIKLAPLVLGPDKIYELTVLPFFEHHEAEIDSLVLTGTEKAHELQHRMEPALDKVKHQVAELKDNLQHRIEPVIEKTRARVEPTIDQIRESLRESVDTVKSTLGMESAGEGSGDSGAAAALSELSAAEAVRRDEELTVVEDSTSKTGLRQRSARLESSSNSPAGLNAAAENEIELAKQRNVLVEKIVWGHGLSAKNDEYQRQQKEKEAQQDAVMADVHSVAQQLNTLPALPPTPTPAPTSAPALAPAAAVTPVPAATPAPAAVTETYNRTAAPVVPPRPAPATDAITVTEATTTTTTTTAAAAAAPAAVSSVAPSKGVTTTTALDSRSGPSVTSKKTILLDTRSIPSVVETYAPDYQKEH